MSIYNDAYSRKLCKYYGFEASTRYTLKCYIKLMPEKTCIMLMVSTVMIFGHVLKIAELPYFRQEDDISLKNSMDHYFNSIWLTLITLTTVGYGDIPPCTLLGRITLMTVALWGSFIMSLLVLMLSSIFELQLNEMMALRHINLTRHAALVITRSM